MMTNEIDDVDDDIFVSTVENPLSYLDPHADLEAAMQCKSIADSIKILCPTLPELAPTKSRGNYNPTRLLSEEARNALIKERNRVNAISSRTKKRVYSSFLHELVEGLETQKDTEVAPRLLEVDTALIAHAQQVEPPRGRP